MLRTLAQCAYLVCSTETYLKEELNPSRKDLSKSAITQNMLLIKYSHK